MRIEFVASDGTRFDAEDKCVVYENRCEKEYEKKELIQERVSEISNVNKLKHKELPERFKEWLKWRSEYRKLLKSSLRTTAAISRMRHVSEQADYSWAMVLGACKELELSKLRIRELKEKIWKCS